ncbi:MAG: UvrD-helicase domain-containing protein [Gemmatimonadetes bacterium]|nr:UvrD-helicase domain-containing protein [Gemmatimonadota bacterium]
MPNLAADQEQRQQALDPTRSFIVQAPAGSGKTELLIQRFLTLLARVDRPEAVVAITFTRKAAAEMRHRILAALKRAAGPQPSTPHEQRTWQLARDVLARNNRMDWHLSDHPTRLRIQTIDSLCAMLVRQMPWISRMGAALQPIDNAGYLYDRAARLTLISLDSEGTSAEVSEALSKLLAHLDNNVGRIEELLSVMLRTRDQWMRYVGRKAESETLRAELESSIRQIIADALEEVNAAFPAQYRNETVELARFAAGNLRDAGQADSNAIGQRSVLEACYDLQRFPDASVDSLPVWLGLAEMFLTAKGERRQRLTVKEGFPSTGDGRAAKDRFANIELDEVCIASLYKVRSLPPPDFEEPQWDILNALMLLLPLAVDQLRTVFQEEGHVDFTEMAIGARNALGPDTEPTDLSNALDCQIQHLLIDEFQDTSQSQFDLLSRLIRDWRPGDERTLFLVGDPMQSIYAFREAEVGLFLQAQTNGIGTIRLTPLTLSVNFRSFAGIVDWVNRALSDAFPDTEDFLTGAVAYEPASAFKGHSSDSTVCIHPYIGQDPEAEAERVVKIIDEVQEKWPDETIAVLVLARSHLLSIVSVLHRNGKRFRAVEIDALGERPVVQDLMALTQALLHAGNRLAWLSILRAPWCGLMLADLEVLAGGETPGAVWDLLRDQDRQERLTPDGRARVRRIIPTLDEAFALRGKLPLRRLVEGVWTKLGGPAGLESRTDLEDASAYLDLLEQAQDGLGISNEKKFAEDVARLFAGSDVEASGNLELMTIHKAKGLEYDTVILPSLGRITRPDDPRLLLWREYMDGDRSRLLLAPIPGVGGDDDPLYTNLRSINTKKQAHERTRLLYVATTRARKCLHLLGHANLDREDESLKAPDSRCLLSEVWNTVEPEFLAAWDARNETEEHQESDGESDEDIAKVYGIPLRRLVADWTPLPLPPDIDMKPRHQPAEIEDDDAHNPTFEWAGDMQRRVGTVVHHMLQRLQVPNRLDFNEETLRTALRYEGLDGDNLDEAVFRAVTALNNTIQDDRGRWILSRHENDKREYRLSTVLEGRFQSYVLDRTFVDDGRRWIIDYKTSAHEGGDMEGFLDNEQERYRTQLENYARLMRSRDSRPITLGLYFPLLQGWREWEFGGDGK